MAEIRDKINCCLFLLIYYNETKRGLIIQANFMPKKQAHKEVTNNQLAVMIKQGFDHVDKRFDDVYLRFDNIDRRFDSVEARLASLEREQSVIERVKDALAL